MCIRDSCGIAPSLGLLLLFRVLQGAGGGGLQPMAQAILADTFPPQQRGLAFALYGITAIMAPTIGPVSYTHLAPSPCELLIAPDRSAIHEARKRHASVEKSIP